MSFLQFNATELQAKKRRSVMLDGVNSIPIQGAVVAGLWLELWCMQVDGSQCSV